ncbi:unnamed protein product [Auanema sp. JU1783]|nr:unnamed protein product [Auanema sp. JU1783]
MFSLSWVLASAQHPQGKQGLLASLLCIACIVVQAYCVSVSHSIVLMLSLWISVFALCSMLSALYSMTITHKPMQKFSYGLARVPVLAVFSTTVLAQLFSIFLSKESFEHLLAPDHHGSHDTNAAHEHEGDDIGAWPYYIGAFSSSIALLLSAYSLKNQPFQHVLTSASSSSLQEHAADLSQAVCWLIPGLSRLLLPRINAMVLLAGCTTTLLLLCEHFRHDFAWSDPVCCLILSIAVFSTMYPLSTYTGMILLQTAPPHLLNQLDRAISEASIIDGILEIRAGHFWQLDFSQLIGTIDARVRRDADEQRVLTLVTEKLSSIVNVLTVQVVKDASSWQAVSTAPHESSQCTDHHDASTHHGHGHSHDEGSHGHSSHGHSHDGGNHSHDHNNHGHGYSSPAPPTAAFNIPPPQQPPNSYGHHGHSHDEVTYH